MSNSDRVLPPAWCLWPFKVLWRLAGFIAKLTGALFAILLGLLLMVLGMFFTVTIIGAIVGVPLFALGLLLVVKGLF